jgi:5-methylthioribose kinase
MADSQARRKILIQIFLFFNVDACGIVLKYLYLQPYLKNHTNTNIAMQELIEKIEATMAAFQTDAKLQAEKGNKAAGTRARKAALEAMKLLKDFRKVSVDEAKK